ncbi:hypothetical protein [Leuconostoc inhae]
MLATKPLLSAKVLIAVEAFGVNKAVSERATFNSLDALSIVA